MKFTNPPVVTFNRSHQLARCDRLRAITENYTEVTNMAIVTINIILGMLGAVAGLVIPGMCVAELIKEDIKKREA